MQLKKPLTLAPTGVWATLVPTGGGRITARPPPGDIENEASQRQAANGIGYGRTSSKIFTQVIFGSGKKMTSQGSKVKMAALENKSVFAHNF